MATSHHNFQFIKLHFSKSGGVLSPEKRVLTEQIDKVNCSFTKCCEDGDWEQACECNTPLM
jgi:hypothetical protein